MNHRPMLTLATIALLGSAALGFEALAVSRVAGNAASWLGSAEARAVGRAGEIAASSLSRAAIERARSAAFDAALGMVRGLGAVYAATAGRVAASPAAGSEPGVRLLKLRTAAEAGIPSGAAWECEGACERAKSDRDRTSS